MPTSNETETSEQDRGARPKRSEARGWPTKRASIGRTSRGGRWATVAVDGGVEDIP